MMSTTLQNLPVGDSAFVQSIKAQSSIRRRLLDIGLTPQSNVTCLFESPAGDPRAYLIQNAVIALRAEDAKQVKIIISSTKRSESHGATKQSALFPRP